VAAPVVYYGAPISFGITIGNAPPPGYVYYDPYCGARVAALGPYVGHFEHVHHPAVVQVMAAAGGPGPVASFGWSAGAWKAF
jgi:hypothetical protein